MWRWPDDVCEVTETRGGIIWSGDHPFFKIHFFPSKSQKPPWWRSDLEPTWQDTWDRSGLLQWYVTRKRTYVRRSVYRGTDQKNLKRRRVSPTSSRNSLVRARLSHKCSMTSIFRHWKNRPSSWCLLWFRGKKEKIISSLTRTEKSDIPSFLYL